MLCCAQPEAIEAHGRTGDAHNTVRVALVARAVLVAANIIAATPTTTTTTARERSTTRKKNV